jgi:hypothetical protein
MSAPEKEIKRITRQRDQVVITGNANICDEAERSEEARISVNRFAEPTGSTPVVRHNA